jgi:hypothetical protein
MIDAATSTVGTLYVVSLGGDPSSGTGAKAVTFWDDKGTAKPSSSPPRTWYRSINSTWWA